MYSGIEYEWFVPTSHVRKLAININCIVIHRCLHRSNFCIVLHYGLSRLCICLFNEKIVRILFTVVNLFGLFVSIIAVTRGPRYKSKMKRRERKIEIKILYIKPGHKLIYQYFYSGCRNTPSVKKSTVQLSPFMRYILLSV